MKKTLAKQLSEWKSNFKSTYERNPKQADIDNDFEINIVYQQYNLLKKGGSVAEANAIRAAATASTMISITQPQEDQDENKNNQEQQQQESVFSKNNNNNNQNDDDYENHQGPSATTEDDFYSPTSLEDVQARDERKKHTKICETSSL